MKEMKNIRIFLVAHRRPTHKIRPHKFAVAHTARSVAHIQSANAIDGCVRACERTTYAKGTKYFSVRKTLSCAQKGYHGNDD